MTEETMTEETTNEATGENKSARKTYTYEGRKVSLKAYAELMARDARVTESLLNMERSHRQRTLRRLAAFMGATPLPPIESRTDAWLTAYLQAHAELADEVYE